MEKNTDIMMTSGDWANPELESAWELVEHTGRSIFHDTPYFFGSKFAREAGESRKSIS